MRKTTRTWLWLAAGLAVLGCCLAGWLTWKQSLAQSLDDTARRGDNVLQLAATALSGELDRFERLPPLIAEQTVVSALAADPRNPERVAVVNDYLRRIQRLLGATDIYLMDTQGLTIAASNHDTDTSFIGGNFAFRPYFFDALTGASGQFYALGTTSGKRGYYFGAPVRVQGDVAGVLVFKIDLDAIEGTWEAGDYAVLVTDPEGVTFLSSRADWRFAAMRPLTAEAQSRIASTRRYADTPIGTLQITDEGRHRTSPVLRIADGQGAREYLQRDMPMDRAGWVVHVMIDTAAARASALTLAVVAMLASGVLAMVGAVVWQRRLALDARLQVQAEARADLERRVEERTHELRQAQADLVQAGKMAALGQMSAALSHEFNQPLAAARTYADNAGVLMDRGRLIEARGNIDRILGLIDRLTSISRHLRSFARAPGQKLSHVTLSEVVEAAVEIATLRIRAADATLTIDLAPDLRPVVAGPVRLQQVLVNILTNAADAVEDLTDRRIHLAAENSGDAVVIRISDSGPGVPEGLAARIFDPFFSTKGVGKGLGLGLSISYNIVKDFGGDLSVASGPGACFVLRLCAVPILRQEAAE
ncbi:MAG: ATP-binding protein [Pseudotabrizicola sp.]|uniref:sensor histidine kinase n=1 Tax=Pseudotabrizicola sp. TaxID=2939647 RepID=UPI0027303B79|nr:ATP-binding protein [Pseudotabrizicola sp.]MDP2082635.1 ATP-binding protein [Pseudotabrizicola sp.]MDZ7573531.1 ATP-binding protein [Pseudotabrizicola sp.]